MPLTEKDCVHMWVLLACRAPVAKLRNYAIGEAATMTLLTNHAFCERLFQAGSQRKEEL